MVITQALIERYLAAKQRAAECDRNVQQLAMEIQSHMGEAQRLQVGPYTVSWTHVTRQVVDIQRLKTGYSAIYNDCCEAKSSRRFQVKGFPVS